MRIIKIKFNKYPTEAYTAINVYWKFKYTDKILVNNDEFIFINMYCPYKGKGSEHRPDGPCKMCYHLGAAKFKQSSYTWG